MRLIDAGTVSAVRSQTLWHGIASAMDADAVPVLSLCRPTDGYVSIGYHRRLDELDLAVCRAEGLPVFRRRIGGGPVLIDEQQLFFQVTLPVSAAPAGVAALYERLLQPAVDAFRALGLDARLDGLNDIAVGPMKVSGTGAGQIGDAVVVVGNVMFDFDHERMSRVLAVPERWMREECLRLMRRHVASLADLDRPELTIQDAAAALQASYAAAFGALQADELSARERAAVERWDTRLLDPGWTRGPELPEPRGRRVKVRSDVFVIHGEQDGVRVVASVVGDAIECASVRGRQLNGEAFALERALVGNVVTPGLLGARLEQFGEDGRRVLAAVGPGLEARW